MKPSSPRVYVETIIQKIGVLSSYLVEQIQWESVDPDPHELKSLIFKLEKELSDLKNFLGE